MADATWPAGLPRFLVTGYRRGGGDDGVMRTQFPLGTKSRPRFSAAPPEPVTAVVEVTKAQLQILMDFWSVTLKRVLPFTTEDNSKAGGNSATYRFVGRPSYEPFIGGRTWRATLPLEVINADSGAYELAEESGALSNEFGENITT